MGRGEQYQVKFKQKLKADKKQSEFKSTEAKRVVLDVYNPVKLNLDHEFNKIKPTAVSFKRSHPTTRRINTSRTSQAQEKRKTLVEE